MTRILFVDDEARILSAIRRMLYAKRDEWTLEFVDDPLKAVAMLAENPPDIVVSDMRMPQMSGAEFLEIVKQRTPSATRVILSGQCDRENSMRSIGVAHQFLAKPCPANELIDTLTRTIELAELVDSEEMRRLLGGVSSLPSPPLLYNRISAAVSAKDADLDAIEALIRGDVALSAKLLQLVNSSFFGLGRAIADVRQALSYLGLTTLRDVVLGAEVFRQYETTALAPGFDLQAQHLHALLVARLAQRIVPAAEDREMAFTAGILHDLGDLVLAAHAPEEFARLTQPAAAVEPAVAAAAAESSKQLRARLGAYMIGLWGLPRSVVRAVARCHDERDADPRGIQLADALQIADAAANRALAASASERERAVAVLKRGRLAALCADEAVSDWLAMADAFASEAANAA